MVEDVPGEIVGLIVRHLSVDAGLVTPDARIIEDLGADSLDVVELIMAIEEAFEIEIPDEEAANICAVRDAIVLVERRLAEGAAGNAP